MKKSKHGYIAGNQYFPIGIYAKTRKQRRKGLSGISLDQSPPEMIFQKCKSIHTFGMRFRLRVLFLDSENRIIEERIVPKNRIVFAPRGTYAIVELPLR